MEILVCVKQVPDTAEVKIDLETGRLIRSGVPNITNPFDKNALEEALKIKDANAGTKVTVISMGPPQATEVLKECLAMGADDAYLISDRAFGGADTLATSYTLAMSIRKVAEQTGKTFDIIFCGKQAIDGDTAQVGPEVAEELDIPQITYASKVDIIGDTVRVQREHEEGYEVLEAKMPVLITAVKALNEPRFPTIKGTMKAKRREIPVLTAAEVGAEVERIGLKGSPTRVRKIYTPPQRTGGVVITEEDMTTAVDVLMNKLKEDKII
jgi:electron transfer flavoprotein beta subunit